MSKDDTHNKKPDDPWQDLVVAILAVNQYSLERTYALADSMRAAGLFEPENLVAWDQASIAAHLRTGQCDRGQFMTELFAKRLHALGNFIAECGPDVCSRILESNDEQKIRSNLERVYGIGPRVISNFLFLRGLKPSPHTSV